jgi:hypothetical protein
MVVVQRPSIYHGLKSSPFFYAVTDYLPVLCTRLSCTLLSFIFIFVPDFHLQVVRDIARVHRARKGVQAAVVDLLAMLASPDVFYHISLPRT